jgi:hypothetical protein
MIILDTNIISASMMSNPDKRVISWLNSINEELLWISSISIYEIQYVIELFPNGKKKIILSQSFNEMLKYDYKNRIIGFDKNAAIATAKISSESKKLGRNIDIRDTQIAGIAISHGAHIATRNTKDFDFNGLRVINPFLEA